MSGDTVMAVTRAGDGTAEVLISGEVNRLRIRVSVDGSNQLLTKEQLKLAVTEAKAFAEAGVSYLDRHLRAAE